MTPDTRFVLVLGGGGLKGLAHVGVLHALVERGLTPTHIVGSSVGALVGAAWAGGMPIPELRRRAIALQRKDIFVIAHLDMAFKRMRSPALYRREPLERLIGELIGGVGFRELRNPLIVNTVDINSGMQVFWGLPGLDDVPLAEVVFASCSLPGMLPPRDIRGRFFVDGAAVNNLPVGIARTLDADLILAVDVGATSVFRADIQDAGFAAVYARAQEIAIQTMVELRLDVWTRPPIYYLHPRVEHISMFSFSHNRELVEEGYRATAAALDQPAGWPKPTDAGVFP
ncbi:MAG: patatin-like phospholipase family protein, partial [Gemmatimonadales bacterium]